jgi:hypothetical protein
MLTTISATESAIVERAIGLMRCPVQSAQDQLTLEHAIGLVTVERNCTRDRAAQILHRWAFPG